MRTRVIGAIVVCTTLLATAWMVQADNQAPAKPQQFAEAKLTGDVLLVNTKSIPAPFLLKSYELVSLGPNAFLSGTIANIGDNERDAGLKILIAIDDIAVIRQFTWTQAKTYYGANFREQLPAPADSGS